jgi:hypothetical protein
MVGPHWMRLRRACGRRRAWVPSVHRCSGVDEGVRHAEGQGRGADASYRRRHGAGVRSCCPKLMAWKGVVRARSRVLAEVEHMEVCFCSCPSTCLAALTCISWQRSHVFSM